ncbi:hypothetical protein K435DRAFT_772242 [Dendrothele bispora CBS 962.96]|uniref:Uncharacterized protein n=1 Tax=Dendrothele bispora (strain CBS 962.96) TaxID=1314807 RepID=A0A4S8MXN7_DENBC|nr:hypothetical protein K435DRAFT_772242 [Dendrothele bispora CBS 962.96]
MKPFSSQSNSEDPQTTLKTFISRDPASQYTFDSERNAPQSEICRDNPNSRECITLQMNSKKLFETMQNLGFFCALPIDPDKTYMECKPAALPRTSS